MKPLLALFLSFLLGAPAMAQQAFDVVVYGGTGGGVIAAVQAGRMHKSVILIEPSMHIGGVTAGGLTATDIGKRESICGVTLEFYRRIYQHYQQPSAWTFETLDQYVKTNWGATHLYKAKDALFAFEPHVAEQIFGTMLQEAAVKVVTGQRLDLNSGVTMQNGRIASIKMESGETYAGKVFIDATYEGDLLAKAGITYVVGSEANAQYGERFNGARLNLPADAKIVDPYLRPGDKSSGILPNVALATTIVPGSASPRVQAYNYRLCLTTDPKNRIPFEKPAGYDEKDFEILLRYYEAGGDIFPLNPVGMPNHKTDTNNNGIFSTDYIGANYDYPEGDYAARERITAAHVRYIKGFLWTIANHPRMPAAIRNEASKWGHAKDEFTDNGNFPHALYVREARRMVGQYVMTEHEVLGSRQVPDPVALGSYSMDCHLMQRLVDDQNRFHGEGGMGNHGFAPYAISYGALVPKTGQAANLLVPVCMSASHAAYSSIRMEPVYMMLGQVCGTAAAIAIDQNGDVQKVPYPALKEKLLADGQILEWPPPDFTGIRSKNLPGLVLDDTSAERIGKWSAGGAGSGVDGFYEHDGNDAKGKRLARYRFKIATEGKYEVRLAYVAHPNRATNVPVTIQHADGKATLQINQRKKPPIDNAFVSAGIYRFAPGKPAIVTVSNAGTDGYVVIDAVQLLPVK